MVRTVLVMPRSRVAVVDVEAAAVPVGRVDVAIARPGRPDVRVVPDLKEFPGENLKRYNHSIMSREFIYLDVSRN